MYVLYVVLSTNFKISNSVEVAKFINQPNNIKNLLFLPF
jgi:hypothetical protein